MTSNQDSAHVVILGGGVAGLEAAMAVSDLAGPRAQVHVITPERDFAYKAIIPEQPFGAGALRRYPLEPLAAELGARLELGMATHIDLDAGRIDLEDGTSVPFDFAFVCVGGTRVPAYSRSVHFADRAGLAIDQVLERQAASSDRTLTIVVPPGTVWSLPAYELALLSRRRAEELEITGLRIRLITPEDAPLEVFGPVGSESVARLLNDRGIEFVAATDVVEDAGGNLHTIPGHETIVAEAAISLSRIEGPGLTGLPLDQNGFIPVDEYGRVAGAERVYAAGDGTNIKIKQGGVGAQMADVAAEHLAAELGIEGVDPRPFRPVLRARLLTGAEPLNLTYEPDELHGPGRASLDLMTWPPQKVSGRYLSTWLSEVERRTDPDTTPHPVLDPRPGAEAAEAERRMTGEARTPEARREAARRMGHSNGPG